MRLISFFTLILLGACTSPPSSDSSSKEFRFEIVDPLAYDLDQEEISEIEDHIKWAIDSSYISGAVALVARNDKIIFHEAIGFSDRAKTQPMSKNNIFRLASMTKPITSTAVMQLVEQGKIDLDDPVSEYIPEFSGLQVIDSWNETDSSFTTKPLERPLTIHHLLTHTSGIAYALFHPIARKVYPQFGFKEAWTKDEITLSENIPKQAKAPLMHQPGEKWTYGTGIDVLGYVIEVVSGMPLDEYFEQNIFAPLGMEDTHFYLPDDKTDRLVEVWFTSNIDESRYDDFGTDYPIAGAKAYFPGGAGLVSTSTDYLRFASALLNKGTLGESKILEQSTIELMMQNQIDTLRRPDGTGFGYGGSVWLEEDDAGRNPGYWGWDGYWQTRFRIDPQNDMVLILMTNAFNTPKWSQILGGYDEMVVRAIED